MLTKSHKKIYILSAMLLLSLCLLCGCEKEEPYDYYDYHSIVRDTFNGMEQGDEYYISEGNRILQYSLSEQTVTGVYETNEDVEGMISIVADENYIYFLSFANELWRIDRQTGECTLWAHCIAGDSELSHCIALKDGYLLYGAGGDIYACPVDGDCETDRVSLAGLFEDVIYKGVRQRIKEWRKAEFNGWEVYARNCVTAVVDRESNETIYTWDSGVAKVKRGAEMMGTWLDGGTVIFPDYSYLKSTESGDEWHDIDCLQGKKYDESYLYKNDLTVEGQKVIGRMEVNDGPGRSFPSFTHDILFEIDTETDTSRIIYETKRNSGTRIIGYSDGWVYLAQMREGGMISRETLEGENREDLLSLQDAGWKLSGKEEDYYIYFGWQGNHLIIWGKQDEGMRVESLEM